MNESSEKEITKSLSTIKQTLITDKLWHWVWTGIFAHAHCLAFSFKGMETVSTLCLLVATCRLMITFANSLDPNQDRLNSDPDLDPNRFAL